MQLIKKRDFYLILGILLIAAIGYLIIQLIFRSPPTQVEISINGKVIEQLDLNKDQEFNIEGYGSNHLVIQDGQAYMTEASCPDQICVHQGKIEEPGQMIVCLPNLVIVKVIE